MKYLSATFAFLCAATSVSVSALETKTYYYQPSLFCEDNRIAARQDKPLFKIQGISEKSLSLTFENSILNDGTETLEKFMNTLSKSVTIERSVPEQEFAKQEFDHSYRLRFDSFSGPNLDITKILVPLIDDDSQMSALIKLAKFAKSSGSDDVPVKVQTVMHLLDNPANEKVFVHGFYSIISSMDGAYEILRVNHYEEIQKRLNSKRSRGYMMTHDGACFKAI